MIARSKRWLAAGIALAALFTTAPAPAEGRRAARAAATADATATTPLRRVRGGMYLEIKARDLRLREADEEKLRRIAARYFKATRRRLVVTGGTRTPERQAVLMIGKLRHGDDIVALYEHRAAATEIQSAYRDATARGLPKKRVQKAIADVIRAQIGRGIYVSKHLQSGAVDVRSWGMTAPQERALREALKEEPGVSMLDERSGPEPHFHLNL
ncbi:MAG: hypothetical protein QM820_43230 [Minicystis sp.]